MIRSSKPVFEVAIRGSTRHGASGCAVQRCDLDSTQHIPFDFLINADSATVYHIVICTCQSLHGVRKWLQGWVKA